jgi:hypothetical protein
MSHGAALVKIRKDEIAPGLWICCVKLKKVENLEEPEDELLKAKCGKLRGQC